MAKRCAYCNDDDEDADITICSCGKYACDKCWFAKGESSAGRSHFHLTCQLRVEYEAGLKEKDVAYEELIAGIKEQHEWRVQQMKREEESRQMEIMYKEKVLNLKITSLENQLKEKATQFGKLLVLTKG